jgi:hypothetical protein
MLYSKESFDNLSDEEKVTLAFGHLTPSKAYNLAYNLQVDIRDLETTPRKVLTELEEDTEEGVTILKLLRNLLLLCSI